MVSTLKAFSMGLTLPAHELYPALKSLMESEVNDTSTKQEKEKNRAITRELGNIERCVVGYSTREGFGGKVAGLFYRIWNAIKAIFGRSDWQLARKELNKLFRGNIINAKDEQKLKSIVNPVYSRLFGRELKVKTSDDVLKAAVAINNEVCKSPVLKSIGEVASFAIKTFVKVDMQDQTQVNNVVEKLKNFNPKNKAAQILLAQISTQIAGQAPSLDTLKQYLDSDPISKKVSKYFMESFIEIFMS